jgi:hypothetical protein
MTVHPAFTPPPLHTPPPPQTLEAAGYTQWTTLTLLFLTWHYGLMALLVCLYWRRTSSRWGVGR